jgi:23S rRNA pseudouridine1911/1915/1917 synthase
MAGGMAVGVDAWLSRIAQVTVLSEQLNVLYEDNHLIAALKPAGMLVQGDASGASCLLEQVRSYLIAKYAKPGDAFVGLLHRLDRPVSGIVLFAKTSKGASRLSEQIRQHSIKKTYLALVEGKPRESRATLVHFVKEEGAAKAVSLGLRETKGAKRAELSYRVMVVGESNSLLEVELLTGRKHQIRAQLSAIGHPIVGDKKYGSSTLFAKGTIALHASALVFDHPVKHGESVSLNSPFDPHAEWKPWL